MNTIPIFLKVDPARPALVVGGGEIARRKAEWLLECGARVLVIAPLIDPALHRLAVERPGELEILNEPYGDSRSLAAFLLAVAATDDPAVNRAVAADAARAGIPVNVVDVPALCSFFVPATVRRETLQLAIGTGGACPSLAGRLRRELELQFPPEFGRFATALGRVREELKARIPQMEPRRDLMDQLASREMEESLKSLSLEEMEARLRRHAGRWLEAHPDAVREET